MKQQSTTLVSKKRIAVAATGVAILVLSVVTAPFINLKPAFADEYDQKIAALDSQIAGYNSEAAKLATEADTLSNKIKILESQAAAIQTQITANQTKYDKLKEEIAANEREISNKKNILGDTLANMYVDDNVSSLELLASSENIGDFVDKQTYRETIRDNLTGTIDQIKKLQAQLEQNKTEVEHILADQTSQRQVLASKQAEQQALLNETQNKESSYRELVSQSQSQQNDLRAKQQAAIAARMAAASRSNGGSAGTVSAGSSSHRGYPSNLANAAQDSLVDPWGMYNRECVSYVAWRVYQKNGYMPYWGGYGNANQWPGNARAAGYGTGSTPRVGAAGVIYAGAVGHIVWVESVNANGTINISQYNYDFGSGPGLYSEMYNVPASAYDVYIYF